MVNFPIARYIIVTIAFSIWFLLTDSYLIDDGVYSKPIKLPKMVCVLYSGDYGNDVVDGFYKEWDKKSDRWYFTKRVLPYETSTSLFPKLGIYSSHDPSIIRAHFGMMRDSGIDGAILVWRGHNRSDNGFSDVTLRLMFENAELYDIKIGVHLQSYEGISNESVFEDLKYYLDSYSNNPSILRINGKPFFSIYESFFIPHIHKMIAKVRNSELDCFFSGTLLNNEQIGELAEDGFDSVFTYFASESFHPPSEIRHWTSLKTRCDERGMGLMVAVAPGYNDEYANDWNSKNQRSRMNCDYYDNMWKAAIDGNIRFIIINSFNNWLEGSNIEPALNRERFKFDEKLWSSINSDPYLYLKKTKQWIDTLRKM